MHWQPAQLDNIDAMIRLTSEHYLAELSGVLTINLNKLAERLAHSIVNQNFRPESETLQCCWIDDGLAAWTWLSRGRSTDYIDEEVAEAHMVHIDLNLTPRTRIKIVNHTLDHWISWCRILGIPVLASTTVRQDSQAFMALHARRGFLVRGSHAFFNVKEWK